MIENDETSMGVLNNNRINTYHCLAISTKSISYHLTDYLDN